ncbi:MAG: hypothetical protein PHC34_04310 [Candidatus Gastranaerophilales bacterium]|nr:hypothetical protein [Candidatus Gastranaerophilales bacterium]
MKNFRGIYLILTLLFISIISSACKFPDNILDWQNIKDYKPDIIQFGVTTTDDFKGLVKSKPEQKIGNVSIFITQPSDTNIYKKIRVGFKNDKLDWIEFTLNNNLKMSKFTDLYGKPSHINTTYNNFLDYYDYGLFNISTDKQHTYAKNITIFEMPKASQNQEKIIDFSNLIPDWKNLTTANFLGLKPGYSIESNFNSSYPELIPVKSNKKSFSSIYIIDKELGKTKSQYKKAELTFNNGLLSWISLIPQNLYLDQVIKAWGSQYTLETIDIKYDLYDFLNVVVVVDKSNKKVVKIGIVSAQ